MLDGCVATAQDKFEDDRVLGPQVAVSLIRVTPALGRHAVSGSDRLRARHDRAMYPGRRRAARAGASDHYHVLAAPVPLFRVGERLRGLAERERPVDDRCHLAVLDDVLEVEQVRAAVDGGERDQPLAHEP